jgi:hypothetical protein
MRLTSRDIGAANWIFGSPLHCRIKTRFDFDLAQSAFHTSFASTDSHANQDNKKDCG